MVNKDDYNGFIVYAHKAGLVWSIDTIRRHATCPVAAVVISRVTKATSPAVRSYNRHAVWSAVNAGQLFWRPTSSCYRGLVSEIQRARTPNNWGYEPDRTTDHHSRSFRAYNAPNQHKAKHSKAEQTSTALFDRLVPITLALFLSPCRGHVTMSVIWNTKNQW